MAKQGGSLLVLALVAVLVGACAGIAGAAQFIDLAPSLGLPGAIGAAWGDYDGDGYADLLLTSVSSGHWPMLLHNNGDLTFTDVSASVGFPATSEEQDGAAWADYNNDGRPDLIIAGGSNVVRLYRNDGGTFTEVAEAAGLSVADGPGRSVAWADYDADGWLDVFVCNTMAGVSHLMHNNGDGTFTDATESAGLTGLATPSATNAAAWADYDNDGDSDLLLSRVGARPLLFQSDGNGSFTEVGLAAGLSVAANTFSVAWADYDNDGWLDVYLSSVATERDWLFRNNGDGTFTEVAATAGMAGDNHAGVGVAWADYDNDGWIDLYVGNIDSGNQPFLYHNDGKGTFSEMAASAGVGGSRPNEAACWADIDVDGRMDLVSAVGGPLSALFHNLGPTGNWLRVRALTSGSGDATGGDPVRDAIGARVEVNLDNDDTFPPGPTLTRLIDGGSSFLAQNEQVAHFGLGAAELVAARVTFPDGSVVVHWSVPANQQITIRDVPADRVPIFRDVPLDYWAYPQILAAFNGHVVVGYADGTYRPLEPVNRAQMAVFIARSLLTPTGDAAVPPGPETATFEDVPNTGYGESGTEPYWAYKYIEYCVAQGVVQGYDATHYKPEVVVTRDQMAVFIARAKGWVDIGDDLSTAPEVFPDVPAGFWCGTAIQACREHGVVQGYGDGTYHPEYQVTRDQMAVYVQRAFGLAL